MASTTATTKASPGTKISSVTIAKKYRTRISETIADKLQGKGPKLVGFLANDDQAARAYALWTKKACEADGICFELREVSKVDLEHALYQANVDPDVHGIMIYYPCFGGNAPCFFGPSMDDYLRDSIAPEKDVEGLCYTYRMNMYRNRRWLNEAHKKSVAQPHKCLLPCTPLAVVKILQHLNVYNTNLPQGDRLKGVTVTVVNRSEIVGRPLAAMLANDGAEVYSVDIDSIFRLTRGKLHETEETVESAAKKSNVIVTGVPVKTYRFNTDWVNPNTTFINISSYKNVDKAALLAIEGVQYVPLVGKVTVAMLERNLLRLYENFHSNTGREGGGGGGGGGGADGADGGDGGDGGGGGDGGESAKQ